MGFWKDFVTKHNLTEDSDVSVEEIKGYLNEESGAKTEEQTKVEDENKELKENVKELTQAMKDLQESNRELVLVGSSEPPETFEDALFSIVGYKKEDK